MAYFEREKAKMGTLSVTVTRAGEESSNSASRKEVKSSADNMELARGIEPPTCGLQIRWSSYFKQTASAAPSAYFDALDEAILCFEGV